MEEIDKLSKEYNSKVYNYDVEMNAIKKIFEYAEKIQRLKARTYQGSWKKRGWQVSIFGNIARKFDRLESIFTDNVKFNQFLNEKFETDQEEPLIDTLIDLGVYCFLAASELMLTKPGNFKEWIRRNGLKLNEEKDIK